MLVKTLKTPIILYLITAAVSFLPGQRYGQMNQSGIPLITVTGDADVKVAPDEVIFTLGVHTWDVDLDLAKRQNDERVNKAMKTIKSFGIKEKYIQTEYFTMKPTYQDQYGERTVTIDGYSVRKTIVVTLKDVPKFEELLKAVLGAGITHVQGIQFRTTELRKYRDQARALAIKAAKEKAIALADELGQKIGEPYSITEQHSRWYSWYGGWWGSRYRGTMAQNVVQNVSGGALSDESTIAPGQITVNARVSVSFEIK